MPVAAGLLAGPDALDRRPGPVRCAPRLPLAMPVYPRWSAYAGDQLHRCDTR